LIPIKQLRTTIGWTQQRLADYMGIKINSLQRLEYGQRTIHPGQYDLLIKALKYDKHL